MINLKSYEKDGYAIARGVFNANEIAELANEIDRLKSEAAKYKATFRHQNLLYVIQNDPQLGDVLRFLQWPAYISPIMQKFRTHQRLLDVVSPIIGNNLKQIINQIIWKSPGANQNSYAYHQDHRFRRPASAFRDLANSYIQTAIAIDPHTSENGCVTLFKTSHKLGDLHLELNRSVYEGGCELDAALHAGLKEKDLIQITMDPGDVALWGPYMVHGSGANTSIIDRRTYLNGFVIADNCDRGEWAFRKGQACELGEPALVQYEDLFTQPEPHYVNGSPHPFKK